MSNDATPRLGLPYLAASQAQKHVTLNEALSGLDGLVQTAVESRSLAAQPASPTDGALYILPASATGAVWAGRPAGTVMRFEAGAWTSLPIAKGHQAYARDESQPLVFDGSGWTELTQNLSRLGIGATADVVNPLTAKLNKALFTARTAAEGGDGDLRYTLNKETAADTLSLLMQTGFSGRAELGLIGADDLSLKVSANGSAWTTALSIDRATALAVVKGDPTAPLGIATKSYVDAVGGMRMQVSVLTANGTYTPPTWAKRIRIVCIGAGGGGGAGAAGPAGTDRYGGGGGGAGGRMEEDFAASELGASLTVVVPAGGAGGTAVTGTASGGTGVKPGDTTVSDGGAVIVYAASGNAGGGGTTTSGAAGGGGLGSYGPGNTGGAGAVAAAGGGVGSSSTQPMAPGGGGGGGGIDAAGASRAGGAGGFGYAAGYVVGAGGRRSAGGAGGGAGAAGGAGTDKTWRGGAGGGGGGGGAGSASVNGGAGGAGAVPGGGGGGGGASRDTTTSGPGGAGGRGEVWFLAIG